MTVVEEAVGDDVLAGIKVVDVDSHVVEPADLWTSRVEPRLRDAVLHVEKDDATGGLMWVAGGHRISGASAIGDEHRDFDSETWAGAKDPAARIRWMDRHGVYAQVLYPNIVGFWANQLMRLEPAARLAVYRAYNDFQAEFASYAPARLIPLANLPFWDLEASIAELDRCVAMGHKGVNFGWRLEELGLPALRSDHWEPLFQAIGERGLPLNFHVGFNGDPLGDPVTFQPGLAGLQRPATVASIFLGMASCISELIMGRICHRYPRLNFVIAESGVGYIPFQMETLDWHFLNEDMHKEFPDMLLPSEYFRRQIFATFWYERNVTRIADLYPDNFMFESDYTHRTSLTPIPGRDIIKGPRDTIIQNLTSLDPSLLRKLVSDNAARVYNLDL